MCGKYKRCYILASYYFPKDKELLECAFNSNSKGNGWFNINFIDDELLKDIEMFVRILKQNLSIFPYLPLELRDNELIVQEAIEQKPTMIEFASERIKNDACFMKKVIEKDYRTFKFASLELRRNVDFTIPLLDAGVVSVKNVPKIIADIYLDKS